MDAFLLPGPILFIGYLYLWMRSELSRHGREYPLFNQSFTIYAEFRYLA